jgi:S1-C subfamily serine protease
VTSFRGNAGLRLLGYTAAGLLGAGIALAAAAAAGGFGAGTTTVREIVGAAPPTNNASFRTRSGALTIHEIYERAAPGVVQVTSTQVVQNPDATFNPFAPPTETQQALGSGFVIDKAGHIITNDHVVEGAKSVEVSFSDNESMKARIVGKDAATDVAVLQVDAHSRALTPLELGDSDSVQVGDSVVAIGNPLGEDRSITSGIVSALQRQIISPNGFSIDHVIQTDAALNHGNSGGPLLDAAGRVIGVNSQIQTASGGDGNIGIGFAIPIDTVKDVAAQLIKHGSVEHAFLGIEAVPVTSAIAHLFHLPAMQGLLVSKVCDGTGAAAAGVRQATNDVTVAGETWPLGGDLIVKADGVRVPSTDRLRSVVAAKKPGDSVQLELYRNTTRMNLDVRLGRQPISPRC